MCEVLDLSGARQSNVHVVNQRRGKMIRFLSAVVLAVVLGVGSVVASGDVSGSGLVGPVAPDNAFVSGIDLLPAESVSGVVMAPGVTIPASAWDLTVFVRFYKECDSYEDPADETMENSSSSAGWNCVDTAQLIIGGVGLAYCNQATILIATALQAHVIGFVCGLTFLG